MSDELDGESYVARVAVAQIIPEPGMMAIQIRDCEQRLNDDESSLFCHFRVSSKAGVRGYRGRFTITDEAGQELSYEHEDAPKGGLRRGAVFGHAFMIPYADLERDDSSGPKHLKAGVLLRAVTVRWQLLGVIDRTGRAVGTVPPAGFHPPETNTFAVMGHSFRRASLDEIFPVRLQRFLRDADHLELLRITGERPESAPRDPANELAGFGLWTYPIVQSVALDEPVLRTRVLDKFFRGIGRSNGASGCFAPAYGLRARKGGKKLELSICFHCENFQGKGPDGEELGGPVYSSPQPLFEATLNAAEH